MNNLNVMEKKGVSLFDDLALENDLFSQEWFWPDASHEEIVREMQPQPDGAFLVRKSQDASNSFTLIVKKSTLCKIRIKCEADKYGFVSPFTFDSVVDLIKHFKNRSLVEYNPKLDVCLMYPVEQKVETSCMEPSSIEEMLRLLKHANREYVLEREFLKCLGDENARLNKEIAVKKNLLEAFEVTLKLFQEQRDLKTNVTEKINLGDESESNVSANLESGSNESMVIFNDNSSNNNSTNDLTSSVCDKKQKYLTASSQSETEESELNRNELLNNMRPMKTKRGERKTSARESATIDLNCRISEMALCCEAKRKNLDEFYLAHELQLTEVVQCKENVTKFYRHRELLYRKTENLGVSKNILDKLLKESMAEAELEAVDKARDRLTQVLGANRFRPIPIAVRKSFCNAKVWRKTIGICLM